MSVRGAGADAAFAQIEEAFRELGIEAEAEATASEGEVVGRVEGEGSIEVPLFVSVSVLLVPFFHALVSKAGEDAYAALKKLVRRAVTVEAIACHSAPGAADRLQDGGGFRTPAQESAPWRSSPFSPP